MPSNFQVISGSRVSENSWLLASTEKPVILQTQTHTYTHTHTHTHTQHTLGPVDWYTHIKVYLHHLSCAHSNYLYYSDINNWLNSLISTIDFPMSFLFKNDSLAKAIYLLIRCKVSENKWCSSFTNLFLYMEKIWSSLFLKKFKNSNHLYKGGESNSNNVVFFNH